MIKVIFRTCEKVNSLHGVPRPFGLNKTELIKICFKSLIKSFPSADKVEFFIVGDEISNELINYFHSVFNETGIRFDIINKTFGNDDSLRKCFEIANTFDDEDIVYFVEDDYLHFFWIFGDVIEDFFQRNPDYFFHPTDYPDQYTRQDLKIKADIQLGKFTHYRQISSTTFTFACKVKTFKQNYEHIFKSATNANDGFLSLIYNDTPCYCPIVGQATHMHEGVMSPYVPWQKVIGDLK